MSGHHFNLALSSSAEGTALTVLLILAGCADWRGEVTMTQRQISAFAKVSKTAALKAVDKLLASGELVSMVTEKTPNRAMKYRINVGAKVAGWTPPFVVTKEPREAAITQDRRSFVPDPVGEVGYAFLANRSLDPFPATLPQPSIPTDVPQSPAKRIDPFTIPDHFPQSDVGRVLTAARVPPHKVMPLYWMRREHKADLVSLLESLPGMTIGALVDYLWITGNSHEISRILDLGSMLERALTPGRSISAFATHSHVKTP